MKKTYITTTAFCLTLLLGSCENKPAFLKELPFIGDTVEETSQTETEETKVSAFAIETVTIKKEAPQPFDVHYKFVIDLPVDGPEALTTTVNKHIYKMLTGNEATGAFNQKKLETAAQDFIDKSVAEIKSFNEEREVAYGYEGSIKLVENTQDYLTYHVDSYLFTGGAHGMPTSYLFSFDKRNCQLLTWNDIIADSQRAALEKLVKEAIVEQYYQGEAHEWNDIFQFALPQHSPAFTANGLVFNYEAYEIDAYAAGMPHCTLPYEKVKSLMTSNAQQLIP